MHYKIENKKEPWHRKLQQSLQSKHIRLLRTIKYLTTTTMSLWHDSDKSTGLVDYNLHLTITTMPLVYSWHVLAWFRQVHWFGRREKSIERIWFFYKWVMLTNFTLIRLQFSGKKEKSVFFPRSWYLCPRKVLKLRMLRSNSQNCGEC